MARYTALAVVNITLEAVDYAGVCEDFDLDIENQTEDGSGLNQRWEDAVATKSRWSGSGNFKVDDGVSSLLVKAASSDIAVTVAIDYGLETVTGAAIVTRTARQVRNGGIQMVSLSLQGAGAPVVTPT